MRNYYDVLEIASDSDNAAIRKAYLKKCLKYHPDKNPEADAEEVKAKFIEVGQAYETLREPKKRHKYDEELRTGKGRTHEFKKPTSSFTDFQSYEDLFDSTVSGMSEAELAATMEAVSVVAGILGSVVGKKMVGGSGANANARSSLLSSAGAAFGGYVASEMASSSVRAIHQDSINRIEYKKECRIARSNGQSMPKPPTTSFIGSQIGDVLKNTLESVANAASGTTENVGNNNNNSNHSNTTTTESNRFDSMWKMAAAGVKAANAARNTK